MCGMERFLCQGLNPFPGLFAQSASQSQKSQARLCELPFDAKRLSASQQRSLTGNSIHGHVMLALLAFVLAHVQRRSHIPRDVVEVCDSDSAEEAPEEQTQLQSQAKRALRSRPKRRRVVRKQRMAGES